MQNLDSEHAEILWLEHSLSAVKVQHVYLLLQVNHQYNRAPFLVSLQVDNNELPVHVVIPQLLEHYNKWWQLHEHWPSNTRRWSVLISISILIIDIIEQPPQHKYWGKEKTLTIMLRVMTSVRGVDTGVKIV